MSTLKPLLIILGINSRQGSSIAHSSLHTNAFRILGITTNASSPQSRIWLAYGIKIAQLSDYSDVACLKQAFQGAAVIFAVTDFYRHLQDQSTLSLAGVWGKTVEEVAGAREGKEGRAIVDAAAGVVGLECFVFSSLLIGAVVEEGEKNGEKRGLQQFKSKAGVMEYLGQKHAGLAMKTSMLIPAMYMEEWTMFLRRTGDGTFTFGTTLGPLTPIPWTHITNDLGTFFQFCLSAAPRTKLAAVSCLASGKDLCTIFTNVTGIACSYTRYTPATLSTLLGPRGPIVVDMLAQIGAKQYYNDAEILCSTHLVGAGDNSPSSSMPSEFSSFESHMTSTLQPYLQTLENRAIYAFSNHVFIFHAGRPGSEEEARATSAQMVRQGFKLPKLTSAGGVRNANGRDRRDFIGNF